MLNTDIFTPVLHLCDVQKSQKNEVFVDLLERLTAVIAANVSHVMSCDLCTLYIRREMSSKLT